MVAFPEVVDSRMGQLRKRSLRRFVASVVRIASLQPSQSVDAQLQSLVGSLSEPISGPKKREILVRYRVYLDGGWREGRSPHPLFDEVWYSDRYPDVHAAGFPGLVHYLRFGWREGRSPHPAIPNAQLLELQ